ncbi:hypothetical protein PspLS_09811 [Pyricularia sp. CBS 133598]|nr:hypothetical protein PspLS_09811 [Pyricularia sp. CBS 133598]
MLTCSKTTPIAQSQNGALPTTVESLTALWCSEILQAEVAETKVLSVVHGSSSTIVLEITYASSAKGNRLPSRLFFKGGFNPELIAAFPSLLDTYRREAEFYQHLFPKLSCSGIRLPEVYHVGIDKASGQSIVVLEDLSSKNCTFGNPLETWPVDRVLMGVEQLAILHATTWKCDGDPTYAWLQQAKGNGGGLRGIIVELTRPGAFNAVVPRNLEVLGADETGRRAVLLDNERMIAMFRKLWAADDEAKYQCLIHGDPHIDNTYMTVAGEPAFLDWQTASSGNCFHDVAYFVASALTVDDRRVHEQRIMQHYLAMLQRHGGPLVAWEEAWVEYRKHLFHGYVLCLAQPAMQPQQNIWALVERYITAIMDHSVIDLIEGVGHELPLEE